VTLAVDLEHAVLRVKDTGIGVKPRRCCHVWFDVFAQEEGSLGRSRGGLGLGLFKVAKIADIVATKWLDASASSRDWRASRSWG
jgi:signal transduction histidine kinase